jgi:hypothetical protein
MKLNFNEEQVELIKKLDLDFDASGELSDDEIFEIDEKISDYFASHGLGDNDKVNKIGLVCESIMDILGDL